MRDYELEKKLSENFINRCSINIPFNIIYFSEERNFIFHKKLTKEPDTHCRIVPETHCIWDGFYSTKI